MARIKHQDDMKALIHLPRTDDGNAIRFVFQHKDHLRFVPGRGWMYWTGKMWKEDDGAANECARHTSRSIVKAAQDIESDDARQELTHWGMMSQGKARIDAMVALAKSDDEIITPAQSLDPDDHLINTPAGILNLRTLTTIPHDPRRMMTRMTSGSYRRGLTSPVWEKFINRVIPDAAMRAYQQEATGYSATGSTGEEAFFVMLGKAGAGKSKFIEAVMYCLGNYAGVVSNTIFAAPKNKSAGHSDDIASALPGLRIAVASETDDGCVLSVGQVKMLTGDKTISASKKHGRQFTFQSTHKLWLHTNHMPQMYGADEGIHRRIHLSKWDVQIPAEERDRELGSKLQAEADAIFTWVAEGASSYYSTLRLKPPAQVQDEVAQYMADSDILGQFFGECCIEGEGCRVKVKTLHQAYDEWCKENGYIPKGKMRFNAEMGSRGYTKKKYDGYDHWASIELIPRKMSSWSVS